MAEIRPRTASAINRLGVFAPRICTRIIYRHLVIYLANICVSRYTRERPHDARVRNPFADVCNPFVDAMRALRTVRGDNYVPARSISRTTRTAIGTDRVCPSHAIPRAESSAYPGFGNPSPEAGAVRMTCRWRWLSVTADVHPWSESRTTKAQSRSSRLFN